MLSMLQKSEKVYEALLKLEGELHNEGNDGDASIVRRAAQDADPETLAKLYDILQDA